MHLGYSSSAWQTESLSPCLPAFLCLEVVVSGSGTKHALFGVLGCTSIWEPHLINAGLVSISFGPETCRGPGALMSGLSGIRGRGNLANGI